MFLSFSVCSLRVVELCDNNEGCIFSVCLLLGHTFYFLEEKQMKKLASLILAMLLLLSITGCGNTTNDHDSNENHEEQSTPEEKLINYLIKSGSSQYSNIYYVKGFDIYGSDYVTHFLYYDENDNEIYFSSFIGDDWIDSPRSMTGYTEHIKIPLDYQSSYSHASYSYNSTICYVVEGNINKNKFSKSNDTIEDIEVITNFSSGKSLAIEMFKSSISSLLEFADEKLSSFNIDVSLSDLGFTNY